jgi:hypothetical protein
MSVKLQLPDEFQLKSPYYNGFADENDPKVVEYILAQHTLIDKLLEDTLYIKWIDGDRKDAIAKVIPNRKTFGDNAAEKARVIRRYNGWNRDAPYFIQNDRFYTIATWADIKRKNQVQVNLPDRDVVFLPNYTGPTVWALFDHKAAKAEALKAPNQYDIDGNRLDVGDKVLYINARYGSGMELEHGTIKEFKAVVDSRKTEIFTIVVNKNGVESKISNPSNMICIETICGEC